VEQLVAGGHGAVDDRVDGRGLGVQRDHRAHRGQPAGLDLGRVPGHDRLAGPQHVALGRDQLEAPALQVHRVDPQMDQHAAAVLGLHDEGVRLELDQPPGDRGHGDLRRALGIDGRAGSHHGSGEHRVGDLGQTDGGARQRGGDVDVHGAHSWCSGR
jgi:hypothetical protein